jgi:hypothetical protein
MQDIYLEGNNGGDYIKISQTKKQEAISCCQIEVGHCCVVVLRSQIPIEFLTSLICKFMHTNQEGFSRSIDDEFSDFAREVMTYNKDFVDERVSRILEVLL